MRARVGDLAVVRFDPCGDGNRWDEKVGIVTGCRTFGKSREYEFIYWDTVGRKIEVCPNTLPPHRLVRARPKNDDWEGTLYSLTIENVEPVI